MKNKNSELKLQLINLINERSIKDYSFKKVMNGHNPVNNYKLMNEGAWEKAKYFLSKLGSLEKGGKIIGRGKQMVKAKAQIEDILSKASNDVIRRLDSTIKEQYKEFPNMESHQEFLNAVEAIALVYDTVVENSKKDPQEKGYVSPLLANEIIQDLRRYMKYQIDYQLSTGYKIFTEDGNVNGEKLDEFLGKWFKKKSPEPEQETLTGDKETTSIDTYKSNKLPLIIAGIGSILAAFGWISDTEWFKNLMEDIFGGTTTTTEAVDSFVENSMPSEVLTAGGGRGYVSLVSQLGETNIKTVDDLKTALTEIGGGSWEKGLENSSAFFEGNGAGAASEQAETLKNLINTNEGGSSVWSIFNKPDITAGTHSDGQYLFSVMKGATAFKTKLVKIVTTTLIKKTVVGTGTVLAAKIAALPLIEIGIGVVVAGALVKLARLKGLKSSRMQLLNDLLQRMDLVPLTAGFKELQPDKVGMGTIKKAKTDKKPELVGADKKIKDKKDNNKIVSGDSVCPELSDKDIASLNRRLKKVQKYVMSIERLKKFKDNKNFQKKFIDAVKNIDIKGMKVADKLKSYDSEELLKEIEKLYSGWQKELALVTQEILYMLVLMHRRGCGDNGNYKKLQSFLRKVLKFTSKTETKEQDFQDLFNSYINILGVLGSAANFTNK
jgi:hypothetical protein